MVIAHCAGRMMPQMKLIAWNALLQHAVKSIMTRSATSAPALYAIRLQLRRLLSELTWHCHHEPAGFHNRGVADCQASLTGSFVCFVPEPQSTPPVTAMLLRDETALSPYLADSDTCAPAGSITHCSAAFYMDHGRTFDPTPRTIGYSRRLSASA